MFQLTKEGIEDNNYAACWLAKLCFSVEAGPTINRLKLFNCSEDSPRGGVLIGADWDPTSAVIRTDRSLPHKVSSAILPGTNKYAVGGHRQVGREQAW
jgi:hypothetical protein